jgi:hypothetical protein
MTANDLPPIPDFPASLEPHEMLEILVGELQNPVASIEGWARVIAQDNNLEAISLEAAESIATIIQHIKLLASQVEKYLDEWTDAQ